MVQRFRLAGKDLPMAGLEPARAFTAQRILSPPVPSRGTGYLPRTRHEKKTARQYRVCAKDHNQTQPRADRRRNFLLLNLAEMAEGPQPAILQEQDRSRSS